MSVGLVFFENVRIFPRIGLLKYINDNPKGEPKFITEKPKLYSKKKKPIQIVTDIPTKLDTTCISTLN